MMEPTDKREGSLDAPTRHPIDWQSAAYYDETSLLTELERVFDICEAACRGLLQHIVEDRGLR